LFAEGNKTVAISSVGPSEVARHANHERLPSQLRVLWAAVALLSLLTVLFSIPTRLAQLQTVTPAADTSVGTLLPEDAATLIELGLSPVAYATWFTTLEATAALLFLVLGVVIFWRRPTETMAMLFSLTLLTFGIIASPLPSALAMTTPIWSAVVEILRAVGFFSIVVAFLLFPDGRFVPGWTRWLAVIWGAYVLLALLFPVFRFGSTLFWQTTREAVLLAWTGTWLVLVVAVQVYRYRYISSAAERQQSKWVVFGFAVGMGMTAWIIFPVLVWSSLNPSAPTLSIATRSAGFTIVLLDQMFVALTMAIAVLRYRLFDIEIIIRRTLVYTLLTVLLGLFYFGLVILLQIALVPFAREESSVAIVLSTLAIAALFTPLRRRLQQAIDRRFYRRKYNAAQALAHFAAVTRSEVDPDRLAAEMVQVIQETMQPASIRLWIIKK
jgi:hypothetical protein